MNTNKFKAGDPLIMRGVVIKNDGTNKYPYLVKLPTSETWFQEEDLELDTQQQPTEQQYNRGLMAATILAGMNISLFAETKEHIEHAVYVTDILISELNKTNQ